MTKRKLFSKKDGTNLKQDISAIKENIKARFEHLPIELKKLLPIAEDIVIYLQLLDDMLEEGHPVNEAIEKVLALLNLDDKFYELIKNAIHVFAERAAAYLSQADYQLVSPTLKFETASNVIEVSEKIDKLQADTAIQLAVYSIKS